MRRLIYLLFFLSIFEQVATAQNTERLEISLMGYPIPLGISWYQTQKEAWQMELKKDKRNEKTWDNYAYACFAMWQTEEDSSKKQEFQKELGTCIKRMKKYIPDTRVY